MTAKNSPIRAEGYPQADFDVVDRSRHPFDVRAFSQGIDLDLNARVIFFVGENGSGKSTLLEAIAERVGFNPRPRNAAARLVPDLDPFPHPARLPRRPSLQHGR